MLLTPLLVRKSKAETDYRRPLYFGIGYPPDLQEKAVDTVIAQAKMLAEDLVNLKSNT